MASVEGKGPRPEFSYHGFHHLTMWVGNAKQAASWYVTRFGYKYIGYRGLETGHRDVVSHAVKQNNIMLIFQSPLNPNNETMGSHMTVHGDGVKDVSFEVDNVRAIYNQAVERGAKSVRAPWEESDEFGTVLMATVQTYGDTTHTFIQLNGYKGQCLPGFKAHPDAEDPLQTLLPCPNLDFIDHCVGNQPDNEMVPVCEWYEKCLSFSRFWSVDDKQIHTKYSALRSIVMTDYDEKVKMPINEPADGLRKSQIQEYVDYYGGAGVQHVALNTKDVIHAVEALKARGVQFLTIPDAYYEQLTIRLEKSGVKIAEDMEKIKKLKILVDFDETGYLLQIFTKPVEDRPTLFYEIIQRVGCQGFGAGNFKSLFEALEIEQDRRGNL